MQEIKRMVSQSSALLPTPLQGSGRGGGGAKEKVQRKAAGVKTLPCNDRVALEIMTPAGGSLPG